MKAVFLSIILLVAALMIFSYTNAPSDISKAPPGTVPFSDSLFIDRTEVTNRSWREFTQWVHDNMGDSAYAAVLQDTGVWNNGPGSANNEYYAQYYHVLPAFAEYPVVGVTYGQAQAYCEWRTKMVNEWIAKNGKAPFKKVLYRLPTRAEWEVAAMGDNNNQQNLYGRFASNMETEEASQAKAFNCIYVKNASLVGQHARIASVVSYSPNSYGVYNMIGNVAEMVEEIGVAKGGSFLSYVGDCQVEKDQHYDTPEEWLGFRCICEVIE